MPVIQTVLKRWLFIFAALLVFGQNYVLAHDCVDRFESIITPGPLLDFTKMRSDFVHEPTRYALNRKQILKIKDQGCAPTCWAQNALGLVEEAGFHATGLKISLSEPFLIRSYLIHMAEFALLGGAPGYSFPPDEINGKFWPYGALGLIRTSGMVPKGVFKPKFDWGRDFKAQTLFLLHLNGAIAKLRGHLKVHPEEEQVIWARHQMRRLIDSYGVVPKTFDYNGKTYTPLSFIQHPYFILPTPDNFDHWRMHVVLRNNDVMKTLFWPLKNQLTSTPLSVSLGIMWAPQFYDVKTGVLSFSAFDHLGLGPTALAHLSEKLSAKHFVLVEDFDLDESGNLIKLKARDSFGVGNGDRGFVHIYADYFNHMATEIIVESRFLPTRAPSDD